MLRIPHLFCGIETDKSLHRNPSPSSSDRNALENVAVIRKIAKTRVKDCMTLREIARCQQMSYFICSNFTISIDDE